MQKDINQIGWESLPMLDDEVEYLAGNDDLFMVSKRATTDAH